MRDQEDHADELRERRDQMHEDESEERPEAIPDGEVDHLQRYRHCHSDCHSVEEELVHRRDISAVK